MTIKLNLEKRRADSTAPDQGSLKTSYLDIYAVLAKENRSRSEFSPDDIIRAVTLWIALGSFAEAARYCNIKSGTIRQWKNRAAWWDQVVEFCRREKQSELDAELTGLVHIATEKLRDRMLNGELVTKTLKDGTILEARRPLKAMDYAQIGRHAFEQRARIRGDVTTVAHKDDASKLLKDIASQFRDIHDAARTVTAKTIN